MNKCKTMVLQLPDNEYWEHTTLLHYDRPLLYILNHRFEYKGQHLLFSMNEEGTGHLYPISKEIENSLSEDGYSLESIPNPNPNDPIWFVHNENLRIWTLTEISLDDYWKQRGFSPDENKPSI